MYEKEIEALRGKHSRFIHSYPKNVVYRLIDDIQSNELNVLDQIHHIYKQDKMLKIQIKYENT